MNPYKDLIDSYKAVKWKKTGKRSLYSAKYESKCGEKSIEFAKLLSKKYDTPIKDFTGFTTFVVLPPRFHDTSFRSLTKGPYTHPYTFLVALEDTVVHLNGERMILKQGDLLPVMIGSELICSDSVSFFAIIDLLPYKVAHLSPIMDEGNPMYITYDEMIKELENERFTNIYA